MQDLKTKKSEMRRKALTLRNALSDAEREKKSRAIKERLFDFANFLEAKIVLFYMGIGSEVTTEQMVRDSFDLGKVVALPWINPEKGKIVPYKIDSLETDVSPGFKGILEPIAQQCKVVPVEYINLAIIPGTAFDERGGRIGYGTGYYDKLIPTLDMTTRKVALAFECQIVSQIPMESHDRYIDIIITEKRTIYKI